MTGGYFYRSCCYKFFRFLAHLFRKTLTRSCYLVTYMRANIFTKFRPRLYQGGLASLERYLGLKIYGSSTIWPNKEFLILLINNEPLQTSTLAAGIVTDAFA